MELSSAEQQRIRDGILAQLRRLDYNARWGIYPEYRAQARKAIDEVYETLKIIFGKTVTDVLLRDAEINTQEEI